MRACNGQLPGWRGTCAWERRWVHRGVLIWDGELDEIELT